MSAAPPRFGCAAGSFVRALWALDLELLALPEGPRDFGPRRPRYQALRLWLPASPVTGVRSSFSSYLLAAAAHVAAHLRFGSPRFQMKALKPAQIAIISLFEDARVERLAIREYPGLARLWAPFHEAQPEGVNTSRSLLARLARALHDDSYVDDDAWVSKGRTLFLEALADAQGAEQSRRIGSLLGNDLGQMRVPFSPKDYLVEPPYRDDNAGLWQFEEQPADDGTELELAARKSREGDSRPDHPQQRRGDPEPAKGLGGPARSSIHPASEGGVASERSLLYAEWDYVISRERPRFCTLRDRLAPLGDGAEISGLMARYARVRRNLNRSALRLPSQKRAHERRLKDGDRLDMPAAIAASVARTSGTRPDPRVYRRLRFRPAPPALLLLLDLSESLNSVRKGSAASLLSLARTASALLASTLTGVTVDWAIHGFSSNGRHDVGYYRFKDFDQPYDEHARARLAGMHAHLSTRLGTALRHAGQALAGRSAPRKLLLVVTDGEPSDVDVHDGEYLLFDAKQATFGNRRRGVKSFCFGLDASRERSVQRIFGPGNYLLLNQLDDLPRKLGELYLRLAE